MTEREQWVKANLGFLKTVVRHHAEPVNSVKITIAAHSGDLEAAEAAYADIMVDGHSTPSTSSQRKGKRGQDDDQLLQSLQNLVSMPQHKFRKVRSRINTILCELMEEESDEEQPPRVPTFPAPASVQPTSARATYTPTALEMYPHMWRHKALAA
ncbi:hypothetical protein NHX12_014563, partial [Muraenolepis orangiensis]